MIKAIYYLFFPEKIPAEKRNRKWRSGWAPPPPPAPQPRRKQISDYPTDKELRRDFTAVQDAWEQYQMLIKLHGGLKEEEREEILANAYTRTRPVPR